jgi:O-antigen ligase
LDVYFLDGKIINNFNNQIGVFFQRDGFLLDTTASWRIRNWQNAIDYIKIISPIIGVGFSTKMYLAPTLIGDVWVHNEFVHVFQFSGLIGLIIFIIFLGSIVFLGIRNINKANNIFLRSVSLGALAGYICCVVFMFTYNQPFFFWLCIALIFITANLISQRNLTTLYNK